MPAGEVPRPEVFDGLFSEVRRFQQVVGSPEDLCVVDLFNFVEHSRPEMQRDYRPVEDRLVVVSGGAPKESRR